MLTTHANENSEGRNNQGKEILDLLTGYINHHVTVNRNLDFKNTAIVRAQKEVRNMLLQPEGRNKLVMLQQTA